MDAKKRMENTLEDIIAEVFTDSSHDEVYVVSNSGMLLSQEPPEFDEGLPLSLATMVAAVDELGAIQKLTVNFHDQGDLIVHRMNERAFLAVRMKAGMSDADLPRKLDSVSMAVRERLPWLR